MLAPLLSPEPQPLPESLNPPSNVPNPTPGAEQTEKADAPREPPPVEPKPDPTSGMAAAEAEAALSESSEQGTSTQPGPPPFSHFCASFPRVPLLPSIDPTLSCPSTSAFGLPSFLILEFGYQFLGYVPWPHFLLVQKHYRHSAGTSVPHMGETALQPTATPTSLLADSTLPDVQPVRDPHGLPAPSK